jgi:hypothetical protein
MVQILFLVSNNVQTAMLFKIRLYTIRFIAFNLDHKIDYFHFISNEEDPYLLQTRPK